ncbi:phosphopantetheine-binding protein [Actinophytocola sediminis]
MTTNETVDSVAGSEVATRIRAYVETKANAAVAHDTDLAEAGILTSMVAMEMVVFLESAFEISIIGRDLKLDNFRTMDNMAALVTRLRETAADA